MDPKAILEFAQRDWALVAEAKAAFWRRRKREGSPADILAIGDQLRRHMMSVRPDWPSSAERAADIDVHRRVSEALHAAGRGRR